MHKHYAHRHAHLSCVKLFLQIQTLFEDPPLPTKPRERNQTHKGEPRRGGRGEKDSVYTCWAIAMMWDFYIKRVLVCEEEQDVHEKRGGEGGKLRRENDGDNMQEEEPTALC
jgi:hypothetical protein